MNLIFSASIIGNSMDRFCIKYLNVNFELIW
jgi:hypothetical protein